ncbi:hypothetical protein [Sulfurisphaera ohwakuensis]|uniref:hypothetical protein n=1 Tax=Sulfurisphaera ohwakuensis TaxID=69656 RepID=UPI0036F2426F
MNTLEELIIFSDLAILWGVSVFINNAKDKIEKKLNELATGIEELEKRLDRVENDIKLFRGLPLDMTDIKGKLDELKAEITWLEYEVGKK